ncbi:hypothetical protein [Chitinilyticum piscinae]|uniref:Uncharacterized protein n=1 Tax=Chitinilyticum piscinae TaxID=2866724 RepID=A0A8J7FGX1_9NEIS|nr:hypothetical protein [Chitinilyticum piscinae]MBE9607950.1 hypothetical protein [Chitinilyticum piscinae]
MSSTLTATHLEQRKLQQTHRLQGIAAISCQQSWAFLRAGLAERQAALRLQPGQPGKTAPGYEPLLR